MKVVVDTNILRDFIDNKRKLSREYLYIDHFSSLREIIDTYVDCDDCSVRLDNCFKYLYDNDFSIASNIKSENNILDLDKFIYNGILSNNYYDLKLKDCEFNANIIINYYIIMETLFLSALLKTINISNDILKEDLNNVRYKDIQDQIMISLYFVKRAKYFKFFYYYILHQNIISIVRKNDGNADLITKLLLIDDIEGFYSDIYGKKIINNIEKKWKVLFIKRLDSLNNNIFRKYLEFLFDKYFAQGDKFQLNSIIDAWVMSLENNESVILTMDNDMKKFMIANGFDNNIYSNIYKEFGYSFNS